MHPLRKVDGASLEAAKVDRNELHRPDIEELLFPVGGDLSNNLGLTHAAGAQTCSGTRSLISA